MGELWDNQWEALRQRKELVASLNSFSLNAFNSFRKWFTQDDKNILEAGSGPGRFCIELARIFPKSHVFGIDLSASAVSLGNKVAAECGLVNVTFSQGDINKLPFRESQFDIVFNEGVVEHFRDYNEPIEEMIRVTKHGGKIIIAVTNIWCVPHTLYKAIKGSGYKYGYEKSFTRSELARTFTAKGLTEIEFSGFEPAYGITRISRLHKFGTLAERLLINPLDDITNNMISKRFGFEVVIKGIKP